MAIVNFGSLVTEFENRHADIVYDTLTRGTSVLYQETSLQARAKKEKDPELRRVKEMFADSLAPEVDVHLVVNNANTQTEAAKLQAQASLARLQLEANVKAHGNYGD